MQGHDDSAPSPVVVGIQLLQPAGDGIHRGLGLLQSYARLEARDDGIVMGTLPGARSLSVQTIGVEELCTVRIAERTWHDTSNEKTPGRRC